MIAKNYVEIKGQLKYFYLIPVDQIIAALTEELLSIKNQNSDQIIPIIFKHVYNGASFYYDFIDANINHTFFNENYGTHLRRGLCHLIYLTLQNNCILNAFFEELALKSEPVKLSAKNIASIKRVTMSAINSNQNIKLLKGDVDSQFFNNRKGIYKKDLETHSYTNMIINALNISRSKTDPFPIEILRYIAPTANFLFMEDSCCKFGRAINSSINGKNILDKYITLWKQSQMQLANYNDQIDKLIFQFEMEIIFGFSFLSSICHQIESIHQTTLQDNKNLKDLEGQQFTNIILQIANLPLFSGKDLLFKYICFSFLDSANIDFTYFEESANKIATMLPPPLPRTQQIQNGLILMNHFFQTLGSISLPVLFSLWNVVIHELIQNNTLPKNMLNFYSKYLTNNVNTFTYRVDRLSNEEICQISMECLQESKRIDNSLLRRYIHTDEKYDSFNQYLQYNISPYAKEIMNQLICCYCNINSLKEFRAPLFFLTGDDLASYSSLSSFITSLQYNSDSFDKREYYRGKSFLINHRNSISEYLFTTDAPYI